MRLALLVVYYGKVPELTNLWLRSCKGNSKIDFFLINDDEKPTYLPDNVHYVKSSLDVFSFRVSNKLNINMDFNGLAYMTCDYRPLFGILFSDLLNGYDYFWTM